MTPREVFHTSGKANQPLHSDGHSEASLSSPLSSVVCPSEADKFLIRSVI